MKKKKDVGVIIEFEDKEYSKEETIFLYQRFFTILADAKDMKDRTAKATKKEPKKALLSMFHQVRLV